MLLKMDTKNIMSLDMDTLSASSMWHYIIGSLIDQVGFLRTGTATKSYIEVLYDPGDTISESVLNVLQSQGINVSLPQKKEPDGQLLVKVWIDGMEELYEEHIEYNTIVKEGMLN